MNLGFMQRRGIGYGRHKRLGRQIVTFNGLVRPTYTRRQRRILGEVVLNLPINPKILFGVVKLNVGEYGPPPNKIATQPSIRLGLLV